jgi:hypothetical protein
MSYLRVRPLQRKTNYCPHCGYSFRRTWTGKIILNPIYAIGFLSKEKQTVLFISKKEYDRYKSVTKDFVFAPLINSPNLMKWK